MHLDHGFLSSMEGHHLIAAYALVLFIQGGYVAWIAYTWRKLGTNTPARRNQESL